MLDSPIVDVALGLIFIYLVLSLVASGTQELIASFLGLRAKNLRKGIDNILGSDLAQDIYDHSLIKVLAKPKKKPSNINSKTLVSVLFDSAIKNDDGSYPTDLTALRERIEKTIGEKKDSQIMKGLLVIAGEVEGDIDKLRARAAELFDDSMERVSGWYVRQVKYSLFFIGLGLAVIMNADSLHMAQEIWTDDALRAQLSTVAIETAGQGENYSDFIDGQRDKIMSNLPLGEPFWGQDRELSWEAVGKTAPGHLFGWLITALAISLGAPFWFDLLGKVAHLKGSGKKTKPEPDPQP